MAASPLGPNERAVEVSAWTSNALGSGRAFEAGQRVTSGQWRRHGDGLVTKRDFGGAGGAQQRRSPPGLTAR